MIATPSCHATLSRCVSRLTIAVSLATMAIAPSVAAAQTVAEAPASTATGLKTVAVAALAGHETLLSDIDFIGELGGNPGLSGVVRFLSGGALDALDGARPIGVMVQTDGSSFAPLVCLPIAQIDRLLEVCENFNLEPLDAGNGAYEIELSDQIIFFRNVGDWTIAGQTLDALSQAPANPAEMLGKLVASYDLGVNLMVQNVPELYRKIAIDQMRQGMEDGLVQGPDETDEQFQDRRRLTEAQIQQLSDMIEEVDQLTIGQNIDASQRNMFLDVVATGLSGTDFALSVSNYGGSGTGVTGFHRPAAAVSMLGYGKTPPELLEKQADQVELAVVTARSQVSQGLDALESQVGPDMKAAFAAAMDDLLDVYEQMLRSGAAEFGGSVDLAGDGFDAIFAMQVSDPSKVESAFKKVAEAASQNEEFPGVEWGYAEHAGVTFNGMSIPVPEGPAQDAVGDSIRVVMGVGAERVYLGVGPRCEEALKTAIDESAASAGKEVIPAEFILSVKQVLEAAEKVAQGQAVQIIGMIADSLEQVPEDKDHVIIRATGVENGVRVRYLLEEGVLTAIGKGASAAAMMRQGGGF